MHLQVVWLKVHFRKIIDKSQKETLLKMYTKALSHTEKSYFCQKSKFPTFCAQSMLLFPGPC